MLTKAEQEEFYLGEIKRLRGQNERLKETLAEIRELAFVTSLKSITDPYVTAIDKILELIDRKDG